MDGVAFKKTFSYAGFEMQPKSYHVSQKKRISKRGGGGGQQMPDEVGADSIQSWMPRYLLKYVSGHVSSWTLAS